MKSATACGVLAAVVACGGGNDGVTDAAATVDAVSIDSQLDAYNPTCTGDGVGRGNGGFVRPAATSRAWQQTAPGMWTEVGPADWSCRPRRLVTPRPAGAIAGTVRDFQTGDWVSGALVEAFLAADLASADAMATSDALGSIDLALPAATDLALRVSAPDDLPTILLAPDPALTDPAIMSPSTVTNLAALVGITHLGGPFVVGAVEDCAGNRVSDVVVTASAEEDCVAHGIGARTFYFFSGNNFPARNTIEPVATENGLYMVLLDELTVGQVQVWGFQAGDDPGTSPLRLLSTRAASLAPGTATIVGGASLAAQP